MEVTTEPHEHYFYISVSGTYEEGINSVETLRNFVKICHEHNLNMILIDASALAGEISTMDEFGRGLEFATVFKESPIQIAVVGNEKYLKRESLFETVARNREVSLQVFLNVEEAKQWLMKSAKS